MSCSKFYYKFIKAKNYKIFSIINLNNIYKNLKIIILESLNFLFIF